MFSHLLLFNIIQAVIRPSLIQWTLSRDLWKISTFHTEQSTMRHWNTESKHSEFRIKTKPKTTQMYLIFRMAFSRSIKLLCFIILLSRSPSFFSFYKVYHYIGRPEITTRYLHIFSYYKQWCSDVTYTEILLRASISSNCWVPQLL